MARGIVTHAARGDLHAHWDPAGLHVWPAFLLHDAVVNEYWGVLFSRFPEFQFYLYDEPTDEVLGVGNAIPVAWDGTAEGLPDGIDAVLIRGVQEAERGVKPTALCAVQAVVAPSHQGQGLSRAIIGAMRDTAARQGLVDLIAPVRPTMKSRYPLTPMEQYVRWQRADGLPLDPWLRVHRRLGAEVIGIAQRSMTITGTVAEWEAWTGLVFPESGAYVVSGALTPVLIDCEADEGRYEEPNVWMQHRSSPLGYGDIPAG